MEALIWAVLEAVVAFRTQPLNGLLGQVTVRLLTVSGLGPDKIRTISFRPSSVEPWGTQAATRILSTSRQLVVVWAFTEPAKLRQRKRRSTDAKRIVS